MSFVTALYCAGFIKGAWLVWNVRHAGEPMPMPKCDVSAGRFGPSP